MALGHSCSTSRSTERLALPPVLLRLRQATLARAAGGRAVVSRTGLTYCARQGTEQDCEPRCIRSCVVLDEAEAVTRTLTELRAKVEAEPGHRDSRVYANGEDLYRDAVLSLIDEAMPT